MGLSVDGSVRRTESGYELRMRLGGYRSLPLSVLSLALAIDGVPVSETDVRVDIDDREYALDELIEAGDDSWVAFGPARVHVRTDRPLDAGKHEFAVELAMRFPSLIDEDTGDVVTVWRKRHVTSTLV